MTSDILKKERKKMVQRREQTDMHKTGSVHDRATIFSHTIQKNHHPPPHLLVRHTHLSPSLLGDTPPLTTLYTSEQGVTLSILYVSFLVCGHGGRIRLIQ
jgi:hypothetical protein